MDWFAKLQLLAIGIICVAYPILLFFMIWSQPTYVIISYFVWIACTLGWICIGEKKKISEFIVPVLIMLLIFTCIYASGYSERDFEDEPFLYWQLLHLARLPFAILVIKWRFLGKTREWSKYTYG